MTIILLIRPARALVTRLMRENERMHLKKKNFRDAGRATTDIVNLLRYQLPARGDDNRAKGNGTRN